MLPGLAKSCQSGKTVLPDVAKSRQRGSKAISGDSKWFQGKVLPDVDKNRQIQGDSRESATRCDNKSPKGFQADFRGFQSVPRGEIKGVHCF